MGWKSSIAGHQSNGEHRRQERRQVRHMFEAYRQKCLSTLLLYPTFRSSSVIMTLSTPRALAGAGGVMRASGFESKQPATRAPPNRPRVPPFLSFWTTEATRSLFLAHCAREDLAAMRLVCHDFGVRAAPFLFADLTITFRSTTFTRPARVAALKRIGAHVRCLTFHMPHTLETFLPPLLDPVTGEERTFHYVPQLRCHNICASRDEDLKYGSWHMTDLLIHQYGPLFHAATNVPSFIRALTVMPCIAHLKVACPGQAPSHRYRRSVVDYALISLRVAVEQAPLTRLTTLSLLPIHPGAILYLRPGLGFGTSPNGPRRWAQIKRLVIHMDSWEFDRPGAPTDHLKLLHDYLRPFARQLERLSFRWKGHNGPCPLTLPTDLARTPQHGPARVQPLHFARLRHLELANSYVHASQVHALIGQHRRTLRECDLEDIALRSGDWDEALAVLTTLSGSDRWKVEQEHATERVVTRAGRDPERDRERGDAWFGSPTHLDHFLRRSILSTS
ncbi:MAG: hypothetical protein M1838_003237 [Thelocarpon superellum]|nr:MAG: hypothetical protein M1838_003237 [Thelocarpon superellum]